MNGTTNDVQATPKGWPPEAHVVSVSKPIAIAFLLLNTAIVVTCVWIAYGVCSLRAEVAENRAIIAGGK